MEQPIGQSHLILVVDDDPGFLNVVALYLEDSGYRVIKSTSGLKALEVLKREAVALLLADVKMPGMSGYELFKAVNRECPHIPVIILSGQDDINLAVQIMNEGGYYYLQKPVDLEQVKLIMQKALAERQLQRDIHELRVQLKERYAFNQIIGKNETMQQLFTTIKLVAQASATVLILGESGTGKELIARAIHENSQRSARSFVAINCGAIPANLMESELFGYERGAFTGAAIRKIGKFEMAHGGTLFLDEIGELPLELQVKLLRVLQERQFCRIGGAENIAVDVRVIAASNKNLREEADRGTFRKDLFYRLSVIPVEVPSLRRRKDDIPLLAQHFLEKHGALAGRLPQHLAPDVIRLLLAYNWPGNVRELENVIERAVVICQNTVIATQDLPQEILAVGRVKTPLIPDQLPEEGITLKQVELLLVQKTLEKVQGNKSKAAKMLGITRKALYAKLQQLDRLQQSEEPECIL